MKHYVIRFGAYVIAFGGVLIRDAVLKGAESKGLKIDYFDAKGDSNTQIDQMKAALEANPQAIVLLAIDGNSIMNRAFYGIRALSNSKGVFTNAIMGFMNIYMKEIAEVKPDCVAVAFDLRAPTFRHKASAAYKANRKGMPEELAMQMPLIKQLLGLLGIRTVECEGYEADDILGTVVI